MIINCDMYSLIVILPIHQRYSSFQVNNRLGAHTMRHDSNATSVDGSLVGIERISVPSTIELTFLHEGQTSNDPRVFKVNVIVVITNRHNIVSVFFILWVRCRVIFILPGLNQYDDWISSGDIILQLWDGHIFSQLSRNL